VQVVLAVHPLQTLVLQEIKQSLMQLMEEIPSSQLLLQLVEEKVLMHIP
jgi:hypothetical protein